MTDEQPPAPRKVRKKVAKANLERVIVPLENGEGFRVLPAPKVRPRLSAEMAKVRKRAADRTKSVTLSTEEHANLPEGQPKPGTTKHDWDGALDFYLNHTEDIPLTKVAEMFGIPRDQLYNRSGKERWQHQRVMHQARILRERRQKRQFETVAAAEAFDDGALNTAKLGMSLVTQRMVQVAELFQVSKVKYDAAIMRMRMGQDVQKHELWSAINYRELVELGKAAQLFQEVGRKALGTDIQTIAMLMDGQEGAVADTATSITDELGRADPDRIAAMFDALVDAGIAGLQFNESGEVIGFDLEGEIVDPEAQKAIEGSVTSSELVTESETNTPEMTAPQESPSE